MATRPKPASRRSTRADTFIAAPTTATQVIDRLIDAFLGRAIDAADRSALIDYLGAGNAQAVDLKRVAAFARCRRNRCCFPLRAVALIAASDDLTVDAYILQIRTTQRCI
jgi:hypothetical protein